MGADDREGASAARIRVVNVAPGAIATPINKDLLEDEVKRARGRGRDPVGAVRAAGRDRCGGRLAGEAEAGYVMGTTLFVDGGMTAYPASSRTGGKERHLPSA